MLTKLVLSTYCCTTCEKLVMTLIDITCIYIECKAIMLSIAMFELPEAVKKAPSMAG